MHLLPHINSLFPSILQEANHLTEPAAKIWGSFLLWTGCLILQLYPILFMTHGEPLKYPFKYPLCCLFRGNEEL